MTGVDDRPSTDQIRQARDRSSFQPEVSTSRTKTDWQPRPNAGQSPMVFFVNFEMTSFGGSRHFNGKLRTRASS
jgi:hypothetical protein